MVSAKLTPEQLVEYEENNRKYWTVLTRADDLEAQNRSLKIKLEQSVRFTMTLRAEVATLTERLKRDQ